MSRLPPEIEARMRALLEDPRTVAFVHSVEDLRARGAVIEGTFPQATFAGRRFALRESPSFVDPGALVLAVLPDRFFVGDPSLLAGALRVGGASRQSAAPGP